MFLPVYFRITTIPHIKKGCGLFSPQKNYYFQFILLKTQTELMEYSVKHLPRQLHGKIKTLDVNSFLISVKQKILIFLQHIRSLGVIDTFDEYEKRKLTVHILP